MENSPPALKEQALGKIKAASDLMGKARELIVNSNNTKENFVTAAQLYVQSGQLFEQAANIMRALGPEYAAQSDIDNCDNAVKACLEAISNIKRILGVQEIPAAAPGSAMPKTLVAP